MIVIVETKLVFDEFDPFDPLLHVSRKDIGLSHHECDGGTVRVHPAPYKKPFLSGWRPNPRADAEGVRLVCHRCQRQTEVYAVSRLGRALRLYLVGADPETAPAQAIGEDDRFTPPGWPPDRRRSLDRRNESGRHSSDRTMEGRRRLKRDRRKNPDVVDVSEPR